MKRQRISLADLAERHNLLLASWKAARGKRHRPAVAAWFDALEQNLAVLAAGIQEETVPVGRAHRFRIHDPKPRDITAACFADRVLHHAVMNLAEARFERALSAAAYACRPGRGAHAAIAAVQQGLQRNAWVVQVDVAGYFPSIDHAVLGRQLARWFKGDAFLALLGRIIAVGAVGPGRGLPIGSLTSQHFANAYLGPADRLLESLPQVSQPVRYMDDIVWFCPDRAAARASLTQLRACVHDELHLRLKDAVVIRPAAQGLRFCGCRVLPGAVWPGRRRWRRYREAVGRLQVAQWAGLGDGLLQRAHDVALSALLPADSLARRRNLWWAGGLEEAL
jgi:hypothetical protein